jgi:hypothetical protein
MAPFAKSCEGVMVNEPLPGSVALLEKVQERLGPNRLPLLIAIDGADGVWKSSRLVARVAARSARDLPIFTCQVAKTCGASSTRDWSITRPRLSSRGSWFSTPSPRLTASRIRVSTLAGANCSRGTICGFVPQRAVNARPDKATRRTHSPLLT